MAKILVLYAHPRNDRSENNARLADRARQTDGVTMVDLYAEYPDFHIDVDREQQRLVDHDIIIFQHPVYWYSSPAILKEWQDLVLEHDFAYGRHGSALKGKTFMQAVTCGGGRKTYSHQGTTALELRELFSPFERMAHLCGMRYLPPFALYSAGHAVEENRRDIHVLAFEKLLIALRDGRFDMDKALLEPCLSDKLDNFVFDGTGGE